LQLDGQSDEHTDVTPGVIALENLTIIQSAAGTEFDSNALHIVSSGFNTIEISHGDFSSHCGTAVVVEGGDNIRFTSNRIHSSEKNGVFVRSGDICTMVENDVIGNRGHGIEVADGGNPNMMRNFIAYNGHCGALVWRGGMGKWIANHFFGNDTGGVSVSREGKPVMLENHIENNGARGLVVHDNGQGEYRLNIVSRHTEFECVIESPTSCPALDSNTFCRGIVGISVIDCAKPVLTSNTVHHMSIVAVEVLSGAEPVMRKNTIRDNQGPGITLNRCGSATVADNAVLDNQGIAAIVVEKESNPAIHGNDVQGGNIGILITGGRGIIWKNTISKCRTAGVQVCI
jgi:parallel beta-helix repeat protein